MKNELTRRDFGKMALGGIPVATAALSATQLFGQAKKPNSKFNGVQIGMNVPYNFGTRTAMTGEDCLQRCIELNVSAVELRTQAIEKSFGLPAELVLGPAPSDGYAALTPIGEIPGEPGNRSHVTTTPEQLATYKAKFEKLNEWRKTVPLASKAAELRKKYEDGGVLIDIVKCDGLNDMTESELDYPFALAKALGARGLSVELSMPSAKRLAAAADRHKMIVALHGHEAVTAEIFEQVFSYGKYIRANLDIGHFVGGSNTSPVPFMKEHHERIAFLHVRDEKMNSPAVGTSVNFGEGDVPVKAILQAIRDNKWPITGMIEFDVRPVWPNGPNLMQALADSVQYCKNCLVS